MSRTKPDDIHEIALQFPCPFCRAGIDEWCITKSGEWSSWMHSRRTTPIREAWGLGYSEYEHYLSLAMSRGEITPEADSYYARVLRRHRCALCPTPEATS